MLQQGYRLPHNVYSGSVKISAILQFSTLHLLKSFQSSKNISLLWEITYPSRPSYSHIFKHCSPFVSEPPCILPQVWTRLCQNFNLLKEDKVILLPVWDFLWMDKYIETRGEYDIQGGWLLERWTCHSLTPSPPPGGIVLEPTLMVSLLLDITVIEMSPDSHVSMVTLVEFINHLDWQI